MSGRVEMGDEFIIINNDGTTTCIPCRSSISIDGKCFVVRDRSINNDINVSRIFRDFARQVLKDA